MVYVYPGLTLINVWWSNTCQRVWSRSLSSQRTDTCVLRWFWEGWHHFPSELIQVMFGEGAISLQRCRRALHSPDIHAIWGVLILHQQNRGNKYNWKMKSGTSTEPACKTLIWIRRQSVILKVNLKSLSLGNHLQDHCCSSKITEVMLTALKSLTSNIFISSISASVGAFRRTRMQEGGRDRAPVIDRSMQEGDLMSHWQVCARHGNEPNAEELQDTAVNSLTHKRATEVMEERYCF